MDHIMNHYLSQPDEYYVKTGVAHHEYFMQQYVYNMNIVNVPRIMAYDETTRTMAMERVGKNNLSHNYGEDATDVPDDIFNKVVRIVRTLVLHGISYPDLTGYNFVEDVSTNGKLWIIDFEHATMITPTVITNEHICNICNGVQKWNPDFK